LGEKKYFKMSLQKTIFKSFSSMAIASKSYPKVTRTKNQALVEAIAGTGDQRAFLAWHPKKEFPYEFTRPLPAISKQVSDSLVKDEVIETAKQAHKLNYPDIVKQRLSQLTFTTKHRWFPRSRDKKAKKTPMDRPYL
jgi:large subunit ribosomal protein L42